MRALAIAVTLTACFSPKIQEGVPCSQDSECPEGQVCAEDDRCYFPGNEPGVDAAVDPACDEGSIECSNGERRTCTNGVERVETCALGCADTESCVRVDPSNDVESDLEMSFDGVDVELSDGATFNTDTGTLTDGNGSLISVGYRFVEAPSGGVPLGIFHFRSLHMGDVNVIGAAALVLVSANEVVVDGTLDLGAESSPAPGASTACSGGGGRRQPGADAFASGGGKGGSIRGNLQAASGGCVLTSGSCTLGGTSSFMPTIAEDLVPLSGGCTGRAFDGSNSEGGGGGAVQIVSNLEIRFGPNGAVLAGGAGGFRDDGEDGNGFAGSGGAGGGSGGGVLLEAPTVVFVDGSGVAANGGGGGSYVSAGADADTLTMNPAPGSAGNTVKGEGGDGATETAAAEDGGDRDQAVGNNGNQDTAAAGGGGGGGVGRTRINTTGGIFDPPTGVILSPAPTVGVLLAQ